MEWLALPACIGVGAFVLWIQHQVSREHCAAAEHIRGLQHARSFAAAMSDSSDEPARDIDDVACRVLRVIAGVCEQAVYPAEVAVDPRQLRPTDDLVFDLAYGLDSLAFIDLRTSLEREFSIALSSGEFYETRTVADAIALIESKLAATRPS